MPPVVTFIGWHNSGKTTLASQVVARLKERGYTVAVIKSTKEKGIEIEQPGTDTAIYRRFGADSVALLAPDQLIIRDKPPAMSLSSLAHRYFAERDIVIAEGFKYAAQVAKIEVKRDQDAPWLRDQVEGVIAMATDLAPAGDMVFGLDQSREIADFIETRFLHCPKITAQVVLTVNGKSFALPESIPDQLAAAVQALLAPLQPSLPQGTRELTVRFCPPPETSN